MKKFAFLLALVAVFAMSACAFAETPKSNDIASYAISDDSITNLTAVPEGNIYFLTGAASGDAVIDLKVNVAISADGASFDVTTMQADFEDLNPNIGSIVIQSGDLKDGASGDVWLNLEIKSIDLGNAKSRDIKLKIAVSNDEAASKDLKATLTEVKPAFEPVQVIEGKLGSYTLVLADKVTLGASVDVKAVGSADVKLVSGDIVLSNVTAKSGDTISVDFTVSKDSVLKDGFKVIGFDGLDEKKFTLALTVEPDPNKPLAEAIVKDAPTDLGLKIENYRPGTASPFETDVVEAAISADLGVSADVRLAREIVADVPEGGFTVIPSNEIIPATTTVSVPAGMRFDFAKLFVSGDVAQVERLYEAKSGDKGFKYNVVVIDAPAPKDDALKVKKGNDALKTMGYRIDGDTLYIFDGAKNGTAYDPIVGALSAAGGKSSSSSCDMGFGLAAVAGLAALALRKRSK